MHGEAEFGHVELVFLLKVKAEVQFDDCTIRLAKTHFPTSEAEPGVHGIKLVLCHAGVVGVEADDYVLVIVRVSELKVPAEGPTLSCGPWRCLRR
jgi:hypothetical protein